MRVLVAGLGAMGRNHARVLRELPGADLVGVVDIDPDRGKEIGLLYGATPYTDYDTALAECEPEAVVVAMPTEQHHTAGLRAVAAGAHVFVEKPIAATVEQGQELVLAAERADRILAVGHIERFNPAVVELKRRLDRGDLGRIFMIHSRRLSPFPQRIKDVGVAADLASHELDMMHYLTGSQGDIVGAAVSQVLHPTHEDIVFGVLRFPNGVLGILDVNWVTPTKVRDISVTGERGMFSINYLSQELFFYSNSGAGESTNEMTWLAGHDFTVDEGDMLRVHIPRREPLAVQLESFLACARTGSRPVVSGADGVEALRLSLQVVETGRLSDPMYQLSPALNS